MNQILSLARLPIPPPAHRHIPYCHYSLVHKHYVGIIHPLLYTIPQTVTSMRPDDTRPKPALAIPPRQTVSTHDVRGEGAQEAASLIRDQIDTIYATPSQAPQTTPVISPLSLQQDEAPSPYARTHDETQHHIEPSIWQQYHTAWQSYYQQYYARYYLSQVHQTKQQLAAQAQTAQTDTPPEEMTTDEAIYDLRSRVRQAINTRAKQVRKSRHFVPVLSAVFVMFVFLFLQYNRVLFANIEAYVSPGNLDVQSIIIDPSQNATIGPDPLLIVPKINVQVPIIWDAVASDQNSLNVAMTKGVAWFNIPGASSRPGQVGNAVFSGHSSNDWLDQGNYKFIFARLEQLREGDTIYINYEGKRYTYLITSTKVVKPNDVSALTFPVDKPIITLITCVPLGTANNRLLVFADQISPDPKAATAKPTGGGNTTGSMPSNSPTFLERLFGAR